MASAGATAPSGAAVWVGFLGVASVLTMLLAFVSLDLVRNLYDFRESRPGLRHHQEHRRPLRRLILERWPARARIPGRPSPPARPTVPKGVGTHDRNFAPPLAASRAVLAALLAGSALSCGCGLVPKSRLDESRKLNQSFQADNAKLRDVALRHRTQAEDLAAPRRQRPASARRPGGGEFAALAERDGLSGREG